MYPTRIAHERAEPSRSRRPARGDSPGALPQPGLRLPGVASRGRQRPVHLLDAPEVLVLAFAPALIAIPVIAIQSTCVWPAGLSAEPISKEEPHG